VWSDDPEYDNKTSGMRRVRSIEAGTPEDDGAEPRFWDWYESLPIEGGSSAKGKVTWQTHVDDVVARTEQIVDGLRLPQGVPEAIVLAAKFHDHGKKRERFQATLGNSDYPNVLLAKSGRHGARFPELFRHEFASALDAQADLTFKGLSDEVKDLALHLIAAHHGRARPFFEIHETFDPDRPSADAEALAIETPRRFARLQRKYGRWGLAYLESLLRAADWAASAEPSACADESEATP
jgi:CRISPR-associated endonuclease/helicase Cas3